MSNWIRMACLGVIMVLALSALTACYETGKVAGEAVEGMEQGVDDMKEGYEDGRE